MEQQNKVKILVAIHKPDKVYGDKVYMPIQVGKSLPAFNLGFQGDNTGAVSYTHLVPKAFFILVKSIWKKFLSLEVSVVLFLLS